MASTNLGDIALVAVADGMGGLSKGELASATVLRALSDWFEEKLPISLETMDTSVEGLEQFVEGQWSGLVQDLNLRIMRHGMQACMNLGTTLTAMLAVGARYSIVHVGDSRVYELTDDAVKLLTEDQTFVKREVDAGRMTPEEALVDERRNMLLQCIGSSKEVKPAVIHGTLKRDATYLLCSDGFRHVLTEDELRANLSPAALNAALRDGDASPTDDSSVVAGRSVRQEAVARKLREMIELIMDRKERDNITAVLLTVRGGGR